MSYLGGADNSERRSILCQLTILLWDVARHVNDPHMRGVWARTSRPTFAAPHRGPMREERCVDLLIGTRRHGGALQVGQVGVNRLLGPDLCAPKKY